MKKLIWEPGSPVNDGFYWFDGGLNKIGKPLLVCVKNGQRWGYGPGGSGPLDNYFYHKSMEKKCKHAKIPAAIEWVEMSNVKGQSNYGWFKDTKEQYGFGILDAGWGGHEYVTGTWVWFNHPTCAADSGADVQWKDGWKFSSVKIPDLSK
jgi:hypothetical protein